MADSHKHFIVHVDFEVPGGPYKHQKILAGTILKCRQDPAHEYVLHAESLDSETGLYFTFTGNKNIEQIYNEYVDYLLAISNLRKRLSSFLNKHKLKGAVEVKVGDAVQVVLKEPTYELFFAEAVLRYKGNPVSTKGILFGVELLSHRGLGTTDGTFCKKEYFKCEDNSGMFVPFDKLIFDESSARQEPMKAIFDEFKIGMRVCIIDNLINGKEQQIAGVLRYLLPSQTTGETLAGVELDYPVAGLNYSGIFQDQKYFDARPNVALLSLDFVMPLNLIEGEKSNKPKLFDQVKSYFISDSKKEGSQNTSSYGWVEVVAGRGKGKSKAHAPEVQSITTIDDELLLKIAKIIDENWFLMGRILEVNPKKLEAISKKASYFDVKAFQMLCTWQSEKADVTDKLGVIARTCKDIGNMDLYYDLLQGVDDDILEFVAQEAYHKWDTLAEKLNLSADIIAQICKKQKTEYKAMCIEVLFIWRTNQPAVSDKVSFLASVLDQLGFQRVATFLIQGLDDVFLQQLSVEISSSWEGVAMELGMTKKEIEEIKYDQIMDKSKQAYEAFIKWKKRQSSEVDKLGILAKALKIKGQDDLANHLLGGLEDGAIHLLLVQLRKIKVDKETLYRVLNFKESHLRYFQRKFVNEFALMKAMLFAWRAQLDRTKDKKQELVKLLGSNGFTDVLKNVFSGNDQLEKMDTDYVEIDYADADQVSDEIIEIIAEALIEIDVTALKTYLKIPKSSSSTHDLKDFELEARHLLIQSREQHKGNFKSVLAETLENIHRKDLADMLKDKPKSPEIETKPIKASKSDDMAVSRPPSEPKYVSRVTSEPKHNFSVGSMVEVHVAGIPMYGVG
ncbi:uncharacterized protein LOC117123462, partial [Anneissia japonica]|uniref:uncharacterized protein LOC117123462 n=1 Tax=Anneissia japonica TaxID=1529436 RepID=UPI001425A989